jgi:hypothetical protein
MKTLIVFFLISCACSCFVQIHNLYVNSTSSIVRLNFSNPSLNYIELGSGASIGEGIAHAKDRQGNIIIWVNANRVYDKNGSLIPGSTSILAHHLSTKITICLFFTDPPPNIDL